MTTDGFFVFNQKRYNDLLIFIKVRVYNSKHRTSQGHF
jgi:hypothetical protein